MTVALLVIDVQEEALEGCPDAAGLLGRINDLSRRAAEAGVPVIFVRHEGADGELVRDSPGWQFAAGLERDEGSHIVEKTFRDAFAHTELAALLERLGVRRLVVAGIHSDFCVQTTALSALIHGYDIALVSDGHATRSEPGGASIPAEAIQAFITSRFSTLRYPGRTIEVLPAVDVAGLLAE
jgi:nicotinamidase-related amidase